MDYFLCGLFSLVSYFNLCTISQVYYQFGDQNVSSLMDYAIGTTKTKYGISEEIENVQHFIEIKTPLS